MSCFLSYSGNDRVAAAALHDYLTSRGLDVFFAPTDRRLDVFEKIDAALDSCSVFIYLNSATYRTSEYCKAEYQGILGRLNRNPKPKLVGAQLDETPIPTILGGWLYVPYREVGADPGGQTDWMDQLYQLILGEDIEHGWPPAERTARDLAVLVMDGPVNRNLLHEPLRLTPPHRPLREAVIFLKPEGTYNPACISAVAERLLRERINIVQVVKYTGAHIRERGLFEQHYLGPREIALRYPPELDPDEQRKMQRFYVDHWDRYFPGTEPPTVQEIIPALRLLEAPYHLSSEEVSELWERGRHPDLFWNERPNGLNKIGFQKSVFPVVDHRIDERQPRLILNGYVPGYQKLLEEPSDEVRVVCFWVATERDWDPIRDHVLGGDSNPEACEPGSLRRQAYENPLAFGVAPPNTINGQQNLLHASATPLEGVREISLWFDAAIDDTYLGAFLAKLLGADQLWHLFFNIYELLNGARGKDIQRIVEEAVWTIPSPGGIETGVPEFTEFKRRTLDRFETLLREKHGVQGHNLRSHLWDSPAIEYIVQVGYAIRQFGHKTMIEKFLPAFENRYFQDKCRKFANYLAYLDPQQLEEEPELVGLAIRVLCSDLLILSRLTYPDDFVNEFLDDLYQRARDIAMRTRKNALDQCAVDLNGAKRSVDGERLDAQPVFSGLKERRGGTLRINVGRGLPDVIAIVAAGGRSTRVQSIVPKPVLRFDGKYLIEHVIHNLRGAYGSKTQIFIGLGWESALVRSCLNSRYRFLTLSDTGADRGSHLGLGPAARLYAALWQLEPFDGPIVACYSDMPLVSVESLRRLRDAFSDQPRTLSFLTSMNAPLPGHVERDTQRRVLRVVHDRHERILGTPERDVGFYMFRNTGLIRASLGEIANNNIRGEYGVHQIVETVSRRGEAIGSASIPREECWTVNTARDLLWLALGLHAGHRVEPQIEEDFRKFRSDYGATFEYDWFRLVRPTLCQAIDPRTQPASPVPLHFLTEYLA